MHNKPLVSIITPVYNAAPYIAEAIDSVMAQEYTHWELIIINDGSTDDTARVVGQYGDKRIQYNEQPNKGVSAARNLGLQRMSGDLFIFLDADDVLPPESISSRVACFDDAGVMFVDGSVQRCDASLTHILKTKHHSFHGNPFEALVHLDERCFFGPSWMVRRVEEGQYFFDEGQTHSEDLLFYMRLAKQGGTYVAVEQPVLKYRQHEGSAMSNIEGLERGYLHVLQTLEQWSIRKDLISGFRKKACSITIKCYMSQFKMLKALKAVFNFYFH